MTRAESENLTWIEAANPPGHKIPRWMRSAAFASDGTVFVPAVIAGNEHRVVLCAAFDGVDLVSSDAHVYVPTTWMVQEYPDTRDVCAVIESKFRPVTPPSSDAEARRSC